MTARLTLEADLGRLGEARQFVREQAAAAGLPPDATDDLVQAVDEVVTNVVEHGYRGGTGVVDLEVDSDADLIAVRIIDACGLFDPTTVPTPDLEAPLESRSLGGMGVHLARSLTDEMRHRMLPGGGNELTLVKRLAAD